MTHELSTADGLHSEHATNAASQHASDTRAGQAAGDERLWADAELLGLMREHAPAGVDAESMLPMLRELVAAGADPRSLIAAVESSRVGASLAGAAGGAVSPVVTGAAGQRRAFLGAELGSTNTQRGWRSRVRTGLIVLFWLGVWELADRLIDNRLLLAGPLRTLQALVEQASEWQFWQISAASLGRIVLGFLAALVIGMLLALIAHRVSWFRELISPLMSVVKTVPVVAFIVMLLIWVGGQALTSWLAFLIVLPLVYTSMVTGLFAVHPHEIERAKVFQISAWKRFWYLSRPAFMPFLSSACRVGVGMSWRAGIMAELLALTPLSIGGQMFTAKTFLDTPTLFAWTAVVMVLSVCFEKVVLALLRWASGPFGSWLGGRP